MLDPTPRGRPISSESPCETSTNVNRCISTRPTPDCGTLSFEQHLLDLSHDSATVGPFFRDVKEIYNMSKRCAICGKGTVAGRSISHAHNVSNRTWEPNLQSVRAVIDGKTQRVLVCTRCLRSGKVQKPASRDWQPEETEA